MEIKRIDTKEQLMELLVKIGYDEKIDRNRNLTIFRGLSRDYYQLKTSLERNCGSNSTPELKQKIEKSLLANFSKYASIDDPVISSSIWRQLILGQHHGLPTRLLDWTHSLLIALHFATLESDLSELDKHDCVVWAVSIKSLKENLPYEYKRLLPERAHVFSVDDLNKHIHSLEEYDKVMQNANSMLVLEPPSIDQRIVNQYSFFTVVPSHISMADEIIGEMKNTVKYIISKDLRWFIRDLLDQYNITERIVYPGLDGTAKWLARHYYVKDIKNKSER